MRRDSSLPIFFAQHDIPPGTYRFTVVADSATTISLPLRGGATQVARATRSWPVFARLVPATLAPDNHVGSPVGNLQIPVPAGTDEVATLVRFTSGTDSQAQLGDECFTAAATCTADGHAPGWFVSAGETGQGSSASGFTATHMLLPRAYQAVTDTANAGIGTRHAALVVLVR
jgi:hypothetical protein